MELRHFRYFVAVAEELHFGRAAARLHLAQPPLSRQIHQLEAELGVQLFTRTRRRIQLTPAGAVFLAEARRALAQADQAVAAARRAAQGEHAPLRVGFIGAASYSILPAIVRAFRERCPTVGLTLHEMTTAQQLQALRAGGRDIGFVRPPVVAPDLVVETVLREPLMVALPLMHPLAPTETVALAAPAPPERAARAALPREPFVLFPRELAPDLYDQIGDLCERAGFRPQVTQEAVQMQTVVRLVGAGVGVSLVPRSVQNLHEPTVIYKPLADAAPCAEMAIVWPRGAQSPALEQLRQLATAVGAATGRSP